MKIITFLLATPKDVQEIDYKKSYQFFSEFAKKKHIDVRFVFGDTSFSDNTFSFYFTFKKDKLIRIDESFRPSLLYIRDRHIDTSNFTHRINNTYLEDVCRDKLKTSEVFPRFSKSTYNVSKNDLQVLHKIRTDRVVLKPRYGANGRNVQVLLKQDITPDVFTNETYIAQEFIDSSDGIRGILTQKHELRVFIFNGKIATGYIRVPAENSFLANISRGGKEMQINLDMIPSSVRELVDYVDSEFKTVIPRLYTIDIMFEKGKPWIVELNDNPGMPDIGVQPFTNNYYDSLLSFLSESIDIK